MEKFNLGDKVKTSDGYIAYIVGIDTTAQEFELAGETQRLPYLIMSENNDQGNKILYNESFCDEFDSLAIDKKGLWIDGCNLTMVEPKIKLVVPKGPVYTPDISPEPEVYVRRFKSGAIRSDDRGRENPAYISPYALKFLAQHFSKNASFFNGEDSAKNYMKGIEPVDIEGSLARHFVEFGFAMMPNRRDNIGPIKQALTEIMANCVMGLHQIGLAEDGEYVELFTKTEYIKK